MKETNFSSEYEEQKILTTLLPILKSEKLLRKKERFSKVFTAQRFMYICMRMDLLETMMVRSIL